VPGRLVTDVSKEFLLNKTCVHGNGYAVDISLHKWTSVTSVAKVYSLVCNSSPEERNVYEYSDTSANE
jgi:hypothetical protein